MEEIIHSFGIDARLIAIQMFNFALLLGALWYFLYTPILKVLREREDRVKQGVLDAEKAKHAREEADEEKARIVREARTEGETIVGSAKAHALEKGAGIVKEAEMKAERMIEDAKLRGAEEIARAKKASEAEVAAAAILAAEAILKQK